VLKEFDKGSQPFVPACEFIAPEVLEGMEESPIVDWWTLGVITYLFLTGSTPFASSQLDVIIEQVLQATVSFPPKVSTNAKSFIHSLLDRNIESRATSVKNIKNHAFLSGIDWDLLLQKKLSPPFIPTEISEIAASNSSDMADTMVMPNFADNFMGFTYVSPSLDQLMQNKQ